MGKRTYSTLAAREARLAVAMLVPAFVIVFSIILFPVLLNFWISFKPVTLGDLRAPTPVVREQVVERPTRAGQELVLRYQVRNSSQQDVIRNVRIDGFLPPGLEPVELPGGFTASDGALRADFSLWEGGYTESFDLRFRATAEFVNGPWAASNDISFPQAAGRSENRLFNWRFTGRNYRAVFATGDFWPALVTTFVYTTGGAIGAILLGLFAAQLVRTDFFGRSLVRGLLLFPYVAPVIAVAFTWTFLLDPFSGTLNALLVRFGIVENGIGFLSERSFTLGASGPELPLALSTVIAFDSWRYFPFAFLFILARLQAIPAPLYESADVDGASPYQKFFRITIPQVSGVIGTLFLLRFMWTFNKFDDVFLLTGGAAGTTTLPIEVYDNAFGRADIGAGAASAVMLFAFLAVFLVIYFRYTPQEEAQ